MPFSPCKAKIHQQLGTLVAKPSLAEAEGGSRGRERERKKKKEKRKKNERGRRMHIYRSLTGSRNQGARDI